MDPSASSLLRICNEDVVAYLKLLELCASSTLIAASNLNKQKKGAAAQQDANDDEEEEDGSVIDSAASILQGKKQILFRALELLRRDGDGETVFRVLSHDERLKRLQTAAQQKQQQQQEQIPEERLVLLDIYGQLLKISRRILLRALPDLGTDDSAALWPPASVIAETLLLGDHRFRNTRRGIEALIVTPKEFRDNTLQRILPALAAVSSNGQQGDEQFDERLLSSLTLSDALLIHTLESEAPGLYECASAATVAANHSNNGEQYAVARRRKRAGDHSVGTDELSTSIQNVCEHDLAANKDLTKRIPKWLKHKKDNEDAKAKQQQQTIEDEEQEKKKFPAMEYQPLLLASNVISISARADIGLLEPARLFAESQQVVRALKSVIVSIASNSGGGGSNNNDLVASSPPPPPLLSLAGALELCVGTSPLQLMLRLQEAAAASSSLGRRFLVRYGAHVTVVGFGAAAAAAPLLVLVPRNGERDADRIRALARTAVQTGQSIATCLLSPAQMKKLRAAANKQQQQQRSSLDVDAAAERLALRVFFSSSSSSSDSASGGAAVDSVSEHYSAALLGNYVTNSSNKQFFVSPAASSSLSSAANPAPAANAVLQDPNFLTIEFSDAELMPNAAAALEEEEGDNNNNDNGGDGIKNAAPHSAADKQKQHNTAQLGQDRYWPVARIVRVTSAPVLDRSAIAVLHGHRAAGHLSPREMLTSARAAKSIGEREKLRAATTGGGGAVAMHLGEEAAAAEEKLADDQKFLEDYFAQESERKKQAALAAKSLPAGRGGQQGGAGGGAASAAAAATAGGGAVDDQALSLNIIRILTQQPGARLDVISRSLGGNGAVQQNQLVRVLRKVADFDRATSGWSLKAMS